MIDKETQDLFFESIEAHTREDLFEWLRSIPYIVGFLQGRHATKKGDVVVLRDFVFRASNLSYRWYIHYGCTYIEINLSSELENYKPRDLCTFKVNGQNELTRDHRIFLYTKIDNTIHKFFPGIRQENGKQPCSICLTKGDDHPQLCKLVGDEWLCNDCRNLFSLPSPTESPHEPTPKENSFAEKERAKMTASLRYSILERDGFRCVTCGRSPLEDDTIRLEVDHIKPIYNKGKTEPDNLQTLCLECNRGKGVKDFWVRPREPQAEEQIITAHGEIFDYPPPPPPHIDIFKYIDMRPNL